MLAGSGGSGGLVLNGVRVLSMNGGLNGPDGIGPIGTLISYIGNGVAGTVGTVKASDEPAALITIPGDAGTVGGTPNGVLLNDGNREKAYWLPGMVSTGAPVNGSAIPWASTEFP